MSGNGQTHIQAMLVDQRQLTREEAQDVADAATAILDGLKVLQVLAKEGNQDAKEALRQWAEVLRELLD